MVSRASADARGLGHLANRPADVGAGGERPRLGKLEANGNLMPTSPLTTRRAAWTLGAVALAAASVLAASPAAAASFRCSSIAKSNDVGPGEDFFSATPCSSESGASGGVAFGATTAELGLLRGGSHSLSSVHDFVASSSYAEARDLVVVSGLGDEGATLNFRASVDGFLDANASLPTQFYAAAATANFEARVFLNSSRGLSSFDLLNGCVRNVQSGISTCNGGFDYGPSLSEVVDAFMAVSIFVKNGDILDVGLSLSTGALAWGPDTGQTAEASSHFHTLYWDGLVFDDSSRNVVLTSTSGFDYRFSALPTDAGGVPEPAAWALLIAGFSSVGVALRRRRWRALA